MSEHDPIETLLKATGRRPAISADRTARIRDVAAARWRHTLAGRARRRRLGWIASLAAAAAVVAAVGLGVRALRSANPGGPSGVRVERVVNTARARHGSIPWFRSELQLQDGTMIPRNSAVTTSADARVALRTPSGYSIRLDFGTNLRVRSGLDFALERGAVYVDSHGGNARGVGSIRIDTPVGTIEDQGTQFSARWNGKALDIKVREGEVTFSSTVGPLRAHAGEALSVDASGRVARTDDAASGGEWTWVESIVPIMEIEGRSLLEFLDWVVRERGVHLRFADDRLAGRAPAIVLHGSIAGMTLDQATVSVLATCGLTHRWEGGTLLVGAELERPQAP